MRRRRLVLPFAVIASSLLASAVASAEPRAVIELFTSQGCSSCPPADKLAGELARDPSFVVLSLAIDYWDYLGWKDNNALPGHGNRQRAYAHVRGDREVYTPQVVVNGVAHVIGSDRTAIDGAIAQTRKQPGTMSVPVTLAVAGDQVTVTLPAATGEHAKGVIWLCPVSAKVPVAINRGENSGHTITYHNVVRRWVKLGDWTGSARTFTVPLRDVAGEGIDSMAVLVQAGSKENPGPMLGAAVAALN
ncbi:MAG: hypothetical protein QOG38_55 [Hyphomicrobiales bacterium]|jgi:hypothetical protein|nr:hypothetical protein [Hyphomicrobiales bacterium]